MPKLFDCQRENDRCLLAIRSACGTIASSQSRASVQKVTPAHVDLFSRVASSLCSRYIQCGKMAQMKQTPKNLVAKQKKYKKIRGKNVEVPDKAPWEAKGWTQQEWLRWRRRRQPDTSSDSATLNPSWWARKGMKFSGGTRSLQEIRYFQKHMQILIRKLPFSR